MIENQLILTFSSISFKMHLFPTENTHTKTETKKKSNANSAGFQIYPPPTTPPEPAPPDHIGPSSTMRQYKGNIASASQSSLDDITCKNLSLSLNFV